MKVHWGLVLVMIIWSSVDCVEAQISRGSFALNYEVNISFMFHQVGDYLTTIGAEYNLSILALRISHGIADEAHRNLIAIDNDGRATIKGRFPHPGTYPIQFSTYLLIRDRGRIGLHYLEGLLSVKVLDAVYMRQTSVRLRLPNNATVGDRVFDMNSLMVVDRENFDTFNLSFVAVSSHFKFNIHSNGHLILRQRATEISPGRYPMDLACCFILAMKNGTQRRGCLREHFIIQVLGCPSAEEGNVEWPGLRACQATVHPCVKYHPLFKGGSIVRECGSQNELLKVDFSNCSVLQSDFSTPFAIVWFTFAGTIGSTVPLSALSAIRRDVARYFPSSKATNVEEFSAYRSLRFRRYGFTMAMMVKLENTITQADIAVAYQRLTSAGKIGGHWLYLGNRNDQSQPQGMRAFVPSPGCKPYSVEQENFTSFVAICQQTANSHCNCVSSDTILPTPTLTRCSSTTTVTDEPIPTVAPSPTPEPEIHFTQSRYEAKVSAAHANKGAPVTTVALTVEQPQLIQSWTHNFGLHGFYSDYFSIGHNSGIISVATAVRSNLYTFEVTVFISGNFTNGTSFTNYTEADVSILIHDGVYFKKSKYSILVDADLPKNTPVFSLQNEMILDRTAVQDMLSFQFTRQRVVPDSFEVSSEGVVSTAGPLNPKDTYYITVALTYQAIGVSGTHFEGHATTRVIISVKGCRQEEGGGHVWPVIHPCGIATVNCSEFDRAFDQYGIIKRQCTKEGYWLSPDFSQCRLKPGTRPFVLLWLTFASLRNQHWQNSYTKGAIAELALYMGNLPVSTITIHYNKRSKLVYGHMQSFKISLQPEGPFNDTDLQLLMDTISQKAFLNYRPIIKRNDTYGVLGFIPKDRCPRADQPSPTPHYQSVCGISGGLPCRCAEYGAFEPAECCTAEGTLDRSEKCNATAAIPSKTCKSAALSVSLRVSSRQFNITWTLTNGSWPAADVVSVNVEFRGFHEEQTFVTAKSATTGSTSVSGLPPSTVHLITVVGTYNDSECPSVSETYAIKTHAEENTGPIAPFQLRLNGVMNCAELKAKLQSDVRQWIVSGIRDSEPSFSNDHMGWLFMECPSGIAPSTAVISGWIYGSEGDTTDKYIKVMQKMVDSKAATKVGTQQLSLDPACTVPLTTLTPPDQACRGSASSTTAPIINGGSSVAGSVGGTITGVIASALLALILIVSIALFLKWRRGKSAAAPKPEHRTELTESVEAEEAD